MDPRSGWKFSSAHRSRQALAAGLGVRIDRIHQLPNHWIFETFVMQRMRHRLQCGGHAVDHRSGAVDE